MTHRSAAEAWARAGVVAVVVAALDQASKAVVNATVERGESINVFFGLDVTNVRNSGVAFGALAGGGAIVVLLAVGALAALLVLFAKRAASTPRLWLPVGMLLGGAAGNLIDRAREGSVVDFIDPVLWPAFNLADTTIVIGVLGLLYVLEGRPRRATGQA